MNHGDRWRELTRYAEWLQLGCTSSRRPSCLHPLQPPGPPCAPRFTQISRLRCRDSDSGPEAGLPCALSCSSDSVPRSRRMASDEWLVRGELHRVLATADLCAALGQCCALCGRSVGFRDMYLHLRHQHPRDYTGGSLFYRYLVHMVAATPDCSVCHMHTAAAHECPILTQLAGLLRRLHHGPGNEMDQVQDMWGVLKQIASFHGGRLILPTQSQATESRASASKRQRHGQAQSQRSAAGQLADLRPITQTMARLAHMLFLSIGQGSSIIKMMQATTERRQTEPKDRVLPLRIKALAPLRGLCNPGNARYMNAAVHGLLWGSIMVGPLMEHQWKVLPPLLSTW